MKKIIDRLNQKTKEEQFFILFLMLAFIIGALCLTGCGGGNSCETPYCGREEYDGYKATGCSIPGCGGCLSSGKGCDCALWPQAVKVVHGTGKAEGAKLKITGCDARYYGGGCLGCGQTEKSCYNGCINGKDDSIKINGFFYGSSESDEKIIGCYNGCCGCVGTDGVGGIILFDLEDKTGVS